MHQIVRGRYFFYAIAIVATWLVRDHPFFWDTIVFGSKIGHYFYENGFGSFLLPTEIDNGHPPIFGAYIAAMWMLFGKTLAVSHLAMLPFLLGNVYLLSKLAKWLHPHRSASWLLLLAFADPVFASQSILVSPDVVLIFGFLLCLHGLLMNNKWQVILGALCLSMISLRGMMVCFALGCFSIITLPQPTNWKLMLGQLLKRLSLFIPAALAAGGFLLYHYKSAGWIGYHEASPWAPSFEKTDVNGFLRNLAILAWRMLDFGRIFLWLALLWLVFRRISSKGLENVLDEKEAKLLKLLALLGVCLLPSMVIYKGLLGHRYLLPIFMVITFFFLKVLSSHKSSWNKVIAIVLAGLLSGNFWIYPEKIAMGWDSTLAHLPWYKLQKQMNHRIEQMNLPLQSIGTAFPNIGPREFIELNGNPQGFKPKSLEEDCYILYSNVMNDFSDAEIASLQSNWTVVEEMHSGGLCLILYKKPQPCEN